MIVFAGSALPVHQSERFSNLKNQENLLFFGFLSASENVRDASGEASVRHDGVMICFSSLVPATAFLQNFTSLMMPAQTWCFTLSVKDKVNDTCLVISLYNTGQGYETL